MSSTEDELCERCDAPVDDCVCCSDCEKASCECCGTCGVYPCECCDMCGEPQDYCTCCADCECSPCECDCGGCGECESCGDSGRMGKSTKPGWVSRGHNVSNIVYDDNWQNTWPEIDSQNFDPVIEAANFYLLEAITGGVPNGIPERPVSAHRANTAERDEELLIQLGITSADERAKRIMARDQAIEDRKATDPDFALAVLLAEAEDMFEVVVDRADATLVGYFHMACAGEARHHRAIGGTVLAGGRSRAGAWIGWRKVYEAVGPESVKDLANLLGEITGGTYGGERWEEAANILYGRITGELGPTEAINKRLFVDRAWTLQHNGGVFLNKINWRISNRKGWDLHAVQSKVLDAHASNPPNWKLLCSVADISVVEMFHRHWDAMNARREAYGMDTVENPVKQVKYRIMCRHCNSNPAAGHFLSCPAPAAGDFNGGDISNPNGASWLLHVEEDEWNRFDWRTWHTDASKYAVSADGALVLSAVTPVQISVSVSMTTSNHPQGLSVDKKFNVTLEEAMNLDFTPKQLLKGKGTLGTIENFSVSMTGTMNEDKPVTHHSQRFSRICSFYSEGYHKNKWPKYTPSFTEDEMKVWKSTPVAVGSAITNTLPNLVIRPATTKEKEAWAARKKALDEYEQRVKQRVKEMQAQREAQLKYAAEHPMKMKKVKPMKIKFDASKFVSTQTASNSHITYVLSKPHINT